MSLKDCWNDQSNRVRAKLYGTFITFTLLDVVEVVVAFLVSLFFSLHLLGIGFALSGLLPGVAVLLEFFLAFVGFGGLLELAYRRHYGRVLGAFLAGYGTIPVIWGFHAFSWIALFLGLPFVALGLAILLLQLLSDISVRFTEFLRP